MSPEDKRQKFTIIAMGALKEASDWISAMEAAAIVRRIVPERCGLDWRSSYRPIAFGLRRLVRIGYAEERIVTYRGSSRTREERREYRLKGCVQAHPCNPFVPIVQPVPPAALRRVVLMED
ncbi:hypothetical protein [Thauera aromatica]|uniref:hypothetical protein n=1 Tax=Thauera aromatica TaxID=59405 RepID=UPI001FFD0508|nr:hypothetical protein [Thauera aromatica]MCK2097530.1 hypothetical protein [Thauera aromatica]